MRLSPREQKCYDIIKINPGITTKEIARLLPEYPTQQVRTLVSNILQLRKRVIYADATHMPYKWYVKRENELHEEEETSNSVGLDTSVLMLEEVDSFAATFLSSDHKVMTSMSLDTWKVLNRPVMIDLLKGLV